MRFFPLGVSSNCDQYCMHAPASVAVSLALAGLAGAFRREAAPHVAACGGALTLFPGEGDGHLKCSGLRAIMALITSGTAAFAVRWSLLAGAPGVAMPGPWGWLQGPWGLGDGAGRSGYSGP